MKYGIYKGSVVEVTDEKGSIVCINDNGDESRASRCDIIEIPEDGYRQIEQELLPIRADIKNILGRMARLDDEYARKKELLREMYMNARSKEISVVNHILKNLK